MATAHMPQEFFDTLAHHRPLQESAGFKADDLGSDTGSSGSC